MAAITGIVTGGTLKLTGDAAANTLAVSVAAGTLNLSSAAGTIDLTALGLGDVAVQAVDLAAEGVTSVEIDLDGGGDTVNFGAVAANPGLVDILVNDGGAAGTDTVNVNGAVEVGGTFRIGASTEATVLANNITTTGEQTFNGPVTLANNVTIAALNVSFGSTVNADDATANNRTLTVTAPTGFVAFAGDVGTTQALADLDVTATTIRFNGAPTQSVRVDDQGGNTATFNGAVVLGANVTIDTDGAADNSVTFTGTINADDATANDRKLTVNAGTGTSTFGGNIGTQVAPSSGALSTLTVTATTINLNASTLQIESGASFDGAVRLGANFTIATDGDAELGISFHSTIDADDAAANNRTLTINAGTGLVALQGNIGLTQPLADVDITTSGIEVGDGATPVNWRVNDQGGNTVDINATLVLRSDLTIETDGAVDNSVHLRAIFADNSNAFDRKLTVNAGTSPGATGTATFSGHIGASGASELADFDVAAASITFDHAGTQDLRLADQGGNTITLDGHLIISTNLTIDARSPVDNSVAFISEIDADDAVANDRTLQIFAASVTFGGNVGMAQALADLDVTAATVNLNSSNVIVDDQGANTVTFDGAVVLGANVTIDTDGGADNSVTFTGTINADDATANNRTLTVNAGTGTVVFEGNIGTTQALADLDVTGATIDLNAATIQIDDQGANTITFSGNVVLTANVTIDTDGAADNNVTFTGTINADDATANNRTLTVSSGTGTVAFEGNIGTTQALADLDVTAATIDLNAPTIQIDDQGGSTITFNGNVVLTANVTVDTDGAADNNVTFTGTINADIVDNHRTLTVTAGTGTATFGGNIGTTQALADLDVTAATITFSGATPQTVQIDNQGGNTVTLTGAVVLATNLLVDTVGSVDNSVQFNGTINADDASANNRALNVGAGLGTVTFAGDIGTSQSLADIHVTAARITFSGTSPQTVQIDDQGGNTAQLTGRISIGTNLIIDTDGTVDNNFHFNGTVSADDNVLNNRTLSVFAGSGTATFSDNVGIGLALSDLDVTAATITFNGASPQTVQLDDQGGNTATLTGAIVLATNLTVDTDGQAVNSVHFAGTINTDDATANNRTLTVVAGSGTATFGGNVGTGQALADFDVTAATINLNVTTFKIDDENAAAQTITLTGAVILGANVTIDGNRSADTDNGLTLTGSVNADAEGNNRTFDVDASPVIINASVGQASKPLTLSVIGAINVLQNITASGDVTFNAAAGVSNAPDESTITINAGATVASTAGDVNLTAEDNIVVHGGITATAAGKVIRITSSDTADTPATGTAGITGSLIDLDGTLTASQILVTGSTANDRFEIAFARITGPVTVLGGTNDATLAPGNIRDTAAADVPALKKTDKAPFFLPKIRTFVIGDQLFVDDTGATSMANVNTDYLMDGERLRRLSDGTPFLAYPGHDLELIKVTTGRGNNDFTVNLASGGDMPIITQIDTQGVQGSPPDDRFQILGTAGGDVISIGDINLHPSLAGGALGPIRAHFELNGFQRQWIQSLDGDDAIDNISSVPGLLDGGTGKDVINSIVNHSSSFPLNKKIEKSNPKNVTLVLGNEDADKLFVGSGALGAGVVATPLINALRGFPDKGITFLIGDHKVVADKLTAVPAGKQKGDNYASSATAFQHGFVAFNDFTDPAPAPNSSLGTFRFGAGDKVKFSTTIAWLKAQLFVGAAVPKLLTALNKQVKEYTRPVTDAAAEALPEAVEGEGDGPSVLDARLDVNRDGSISAADALAIINELNAFGSHRVPPAPEGEADDEDPSLTPTLDVNGDEYLSAADALAVINVLNVLRQEANEEDAATDELMVDFAEEDEAASPASAPTAPAVNTSATDALMLMLASDTATAKKK